MSQQRHAFVQTAMVTYIIRNFFSGLPQVTKPNASWTEDRIALRSFGLRVNLQELPEGSSRAEENYAWWSKASGLDREDRGL